jgi:hypothetical protein
MEEIIIKRSDGSIVNPRICIDCKNKIMQGCEVCKLCKKYPFCGKCIYKRTLLLGQEVYLCHNCIFFDKK